MRDKDQVLLGEAYMQVQEGLKSKLAAASLGALAGLGSTQAQPVSYDDLADREAIRHSVSPEYSPQGAYDKGVDLVHAKKPVPEELLKAIASREDLAKRFAYFLVIKGLDLPDILRNVKGVGDMDKQIQSSIVGP